MMQQDIRNNKKGFVLVMVAGLLIVMGIFMLKSFPVEVDIVAKKVDRSDNKLQEVKRALLMYYETNGALPCPSDPDIAMNVAGFGAAVANCATGLVQSGTGNVIKQGGVPIKDIGLPLSHAFDEWGNRFTYVMDSSYTNFKEGGDNILVLDSAGAAVTGVNSGEIPLFMGLIISHGKDGIGAFNRGDSVAAVRDKACAGAANTQGENCDDDVNFMSDKWNATNDDLIEYLTPCPAAVNGCVLWLDATNINGLGNTGLSNGDALSTWVDKSGSGNTATSSGARRPDFADNAMNGIDTVDFGPSNHDMDTPALENYGSFLAVFDRENDAQFLGQIGSGANYLLDIAGYDKFRLEGGAEGTANLTTIVRDMMVYAESPDSAISGAQMFSIGKSSTNLKGNIAEFVVYPTALSTANRQKVECAMARKWATFPKTNLQFWVDAMDIDGDGDTSAGDQPSNGDDVDTWHDKSGNNIDLFGASILLDDTVSTFPSWPITAPQNNKDPKYYTSVLNSKPGIVFDGSGEDYMLHDKSSAATNNLIRTSSNQITVFTVSHSDYSAVANESDMLVSYNSPNHGSWVHHSNSCAVSERGYTNGAGGVWSRVDYSDLLNTPAIRVTSYNSTTQNCYVDNQLQGTTSPNS